MNRVSNKGLIFTLLIIGFACLAIGLYSVYHKPQVQAINTPETPKKNSVTKRIEIPATKMWLDTGIDVDNKYVVIKYESGQWSNGGKEPNWRDGNGEEGPYSGTIVPGAPLCSLVGKTNEGSFLVGNSKEGHLGHGRLFLSINDTEISFKDNVGFLVVNVTAREE